MLKRFKSRQPVSILLVTFSVLAFRPAFSYGQAPADGRSDDRDQIIRKLVERVESLERKVRELEVGNEPARPAGRSLLTDKALEGITAGGDAPPAGSAPAPAPGVSAAAPAAAPAEAPKLPTAAEGLPAAVAQTQPDEEERDVSRIPLVAVERGGTLLRPGMFQLEPSFTYTHNESTRLIITGFSIIPLIILGTLESEKLKQDVWSTSFSGRYGLMKDVQLDFRLPLGWQKHSRIRVSNDRVGLAEDNSSEWGLGDVEFGGTYQFFYEKGWMPDMNYSLRARAPTGRSQFDIFESITRRGLFQDVEDFVSRLGGEGLPLGSGFWGITQSISMVKAMDPAVLFSTISYSHNISRNVTLVTLNPQAVPGVPGGSVVIPAELRTKLDPGDNLSFSMGVALSLNNQFSMNFSFTERYTFQSKREGVKIVDSDSNEATFGMGLSLALSRQIGLDFRGNFGLTPDASNVSFSFSLPMTFISYRELIPFSLFEFIGSKILPASTPSVGESK